MRTERTILVVDIETTGFFDQGGKIVEIGIVKLDLNSGVVTPAYDSLVKEEGFDESHRKGKLGWIFRNSDLRFQDVEIAPTLSSQKYKIQKLFNKYTATAYNKAFDFGFLADRGFKIKELPCIMETATNFVNIWYNNNELKWPTVEEAWNVIIGEPDYKELHRGLSDARDEAKIAFALYKLGELKIERSKRTHNYYGNVKACEDTFSDYSSYEADYCGLDRENFDTGIEYFNKHGQLERFYDLSYGSLLFYTTYFYNSEGNEIQWKKYRDNNNPEYRRAEYDKNKNLILKHYFNDKCTYEEKCISEYDANKNLILKQFYDKYGEIESDKTLKYIYDDKSNIINFLKRYEWGLGRTDYSYDENNNKISETSGNTVNKYIYNNECKLIEELRFGTYTHVEQRILYKYDKYGRVVEQIRLSGGNDKRKLFRYNDQGDLISRESYDGLSWKLLGISEYSEFDSYGNWRVNIVTNNGKMSQKHIRKFEYY